MGIDNINRALQTKKLAKQNIFVPYIMAGDGGLDKLERQISFLEECGVTAIELGIPFSDPVADGPTVQAAGERALAHGTTLAGVLALLRQTKVKRNVPIILMTYFNPIYIYGIERFTLECLEAGVDGVIIPDLPLEEEHIVDQTFKDHSLALIRLVALTSTPERIDEMMKRAEGFLYAVSVTGTTGARSAHDESVFTYLADLKKKSPVPVLAGFGISSPEQAKALSRACDGVIVGSKIVDLLHQGRYEELKLFIEHSL